MRDSLNEDGQQLGCPELDVLVRKGEGSDDRSELSRARSALSVPSLTRARSERARPTHLTRGANGSSEFFELSPRNSFSRSGESARGEQSERRHRRWGGGRWSARCSLRLSVRSQAGHGPASGRLRPASKSQHLIASMSSIYPCAAVLIPAAHPPSRCPSPLPL